MDEFISEHLLLGNFPDGFAYYQIILDSAGRPADYVFLEVNPAFEKLTGLRREGILGKRLTEVFPGIKNSSFDWIGTYAKVALSGETLRFESFFEPLSRWYEVVAYSDRPGFFVTIFRDITKDKELQEMLQFERAQFFSIFDSLEEIVYVSDPHTYEVLYTNRYTQEMFGKNLIGGLCYEEFQGRTIPCPFCTNDLILKRKGEPYRWEYYNPTLKRYYWITDRIIRWSDGRDVRFEMAIDITTQKEIQNQLQESEERWHITLASLAEGVIVADLGGRVVYMNPAAEKLTGWRLQEGKGRLWSEVFWIVNACTRQQTLDLIENVLRSGAVKKLANDTVLIAKDGTEYYLAGSASPLRDAQGNTQGVVIVFQDVSEEYKLRKEIERRERRYHAILSSIQEVVFTLDREGRHTGVYGGWLNHYGLHPEEFLGKSAKDILGEKASLVHLMANEKAFRGEPVVYEWSMVKDGKRFYFQTSLSPLQDERGFIQEVVGVGRNITALRHAEELHRRLLDGIPYPACLVNRKHQIVVQNKAAESIAGSKIGDPCWFPFHGTDILSEEQKREFEQSGVLPQEVRCCFCKGDEALRRQESLVEEVELGGKVYQIGWVPLDEEICLCYAFDVTKYKEMERMLRRERDQMEKYLDTAEVIFLILDPGGKVLLLNRKGEEILGCTQEEVVGKNWFDLYIPKHTQERVKRDFAQMVSKETESVIYMEYPILTRNGIERLIAWRNTTLLGEKMDIEALLSVGIDITESRKMEREIQYLTFHDALTGLYNRAFSERELSKLDNPRELPISVLMVDVNGLKLVNDTYGHEWGDELLRSVAKVLQASCRKEDIVARFGGDEFVVFLPKTSYDRAWEVYQRIREKAQKVYVRDVPLSLALGLATKEREEEELFEVIRRAEDEMYRQKLSEAKSSRSAIINALLKTLEAKSYETQIHTLRMQEIGLAIAEKLRLPDSEMNRLKVAIMLHDVGKIVLPEGILRKSGPLSPEEWELIKTHPEFGYRIVRSTQEFAHVSEEVWSHHERWDGSGYPRGLKGEEIPLLARIITLVDAYEVMLHGRPYKRAMSEKEIIKEFERHAGTQFDPYLVELFLSLLREKNKM
ncbi:MAG: sensor domain-containing diguanylate cyclase/phosphohydrolase [Candidatus Caldatribacteriaceae bacterium]